MFISELARNPDFYLTIMVLVVFSICCHEYAHAQMALWQGDHTAADAGHLTLNPLVQMGPVSLVICALIGIAWGRVPVNPANYRYRYSKALVAFAGPLMNLLLFVSFCLLAALFHRLAMPERLIAFFFFGAILNIVLFIFNMLPVPMLDGADVFYFLFPKINDLNQEVRNGIQAFLFIVVFLSFDTLYRIGAYFARLLIMLFEKIFY